MKFTMIFLSLLLALVTACSESNDNDRSPEVPDFTQEIKADLNKFATELVVSTENNIFNPKVEKKQNKSNHYVVTFETSDPNLMKKSSNSAVANDATNALWGAKFCTEELEAIIIKNNIERVEGRIINGEMFLAMCDDTDATTNELLTKDMLDNLKRIKYMMEQVSQR